MTSVWLRRMLHAFTAVVALAALVSATALRATTLFLVLAAILLEFVRLRSSVWHRRVAKIVPVYRDAEITRPSGAMWLACGYAVAAWLPGNAAVAGVLAGAFADPAAAAVGMRWGAGGGGGGGGARVSGKSWIGSGTAALVIAVIAVVTGHALVATLVASLAGAGLERWSTPVDDNLVVAPGVAAVLAALA